VCERTWTLAPAEERIAPRAIYLDGALDRVKGLQEDTNMAFEMLRIEGGVRTHAATQAYQLKDVRLLGGRLIKGAMSQPISQLAEHVPRSEEVELSSVAIGSTLLGSIYFGHWMRDDATLRLAAQELAPTIDIARRHYTHAAGYRSLLGLSEQVVSRARFGELILVDDWGQNAYKRRRYDELRSTLRRSVTAKGAERVYLKRGTTSAARGRTMVNAAEVEAALVARGFVAADPDVMTAEEIARISNDAEIVVGLEGSHLAHAIYTIAEGGTLLVLQPPCRFNNVYKDLADAIDLRYAFTVGASCDGGFTIEIDRLNRLLDLVAA
jgi:hypothetical protein